MDESTPWKIVNINKGEYLVVWKVERKINGGTETGFFKFTNSKNYKYIGPLLANELICNQLAKIAGLPVVKTVVTRINGRTGVISLAKHSHSCRRWDQVIDKTTAFTKILNPKRLYKTFVFDIWVCNIDRSGKNMIVYPKGKKYDFYLIDHELTLLGAIRYEDKPWNSTYWDNVQEYTSGYNPALLRYIKKYDQLAPYIQEIQSIRSDAVRSILNSLPSSLLSQPDKILIEKILLRRQRRLSYIASCCVSKSFRTKFDLV